MKAEEEEEEVAVMSHLEPRARGMYFAVIFFRAISHVIIDQNRGKVTCAYICRALLSARVYFAGDLRAATSRKLYMSSGKLWYINGIYII